MASADWVTFDCYGTLVDWESGITDALMRHLPAGTDRAALAEWYIAMEAEFESEGYHLYRDVLDRTGRRILAALDAPIAEGVTSPLPTSLADWLPFPEVPLALSALRQRGYKIAILSNVDRDLLALSVARLGIEPDLAVTAQDCGSYKPAHGHWLRFQEKSGASPVRTVHVAASQFHDIVPATALGYRTVFVNRHDETIGAAAPTRQIPDLATLPDVLDALG